MRMRKKFTVNFYRLPGDCVRGRLQSTHRVADDISWSLCC